MGDCYIGDDFDIFFPVALDARGNIVDLTSATLVCDAQTGSAAKVAAATVLIDNATAGLCRARFTSAQTASFVANATYRYDGRVTLSSGLVRTIGKGTFRAVAATTPTP